MSPHQRHVAEPLTINIFILDVKLSSLAICFVFQCEWPITLEELCVQLYK